MPEWEKRITVKVPEDLHRKVKIKATYLGKTISDVVREFLEQFVEDGLQHEEKRNRQ